METYTHLIIGGGMTADAAVRGIRELDASSSIGIISAEPSLPYNRPPLSKGLWSGKEFDTIWCKTDKENVSFHLERRVVSIKPDEHLVTDDAGTVYHYKNLLIATGGTPHKLSCPNEGVIYFRTVDDYHNLRTHYDQGNDFVVIGAGFIGTEIASALAMNGKNVSLMFPEPSIGHNLYPKGFSLFLNAYYTENGVQLLPEMETDPSIYYLPRRN